MKIECPALNPNRTTPATVNRVQLFERDETDEGMGHQFENGHAELENVSGAYS